MINGPREATLQVLQLIDIHGTTFYDLVFEQHDSPGQIRHARIGAESIYAGARAGDTVRINYLMGVVVSVERQGVL